MGKMHPDLVSAPCFQVAFEKARNRLSVWSEKPLQYLPMGNSRAAALAHGLLVAGMGVSADWGIDQAFRAVRSAPDQSEVATFEWALILAGELIGKRSVGLVGLGDNHQTAGVLVEAMDDTRTLDPADAGEARAQVGNQRIDEPTRGGTGRRGGDQAPPPLPSN